MLKTTILLEKSTSKRLGIDDNKVDRFGINSSEKLLESQKN